MVRRFLRHIDLKKIKIWSRLQMNKIELFVDFL